MSAAVLARAVAVSLVLVAAGPAPVRAEEGTINALSGWQGRLQVFATGPKQAFVLGTFGGVLFVEKETGTLDAAQLACPAAVDLDFEANSQRGEGRCVVYTRGGDRAFGRWTCTGQLGSGCHGTFMLTGGTGRLEGISGDGKFVVRLATAELTDLGPQASEHDVAGLAIWPGLRYRVP